MFSETTIIGNLGKDPEMKYTTSGVPVTSFSVATSKKWTNVEGESQEKTTWFRVTCWRKLAEITAQYLKKGRQVLVVGEVEASSWTDKEGNARASLELTAHEVKFLGGKSEGNEGDDSRPAQHGTITDEEIPF